jgi:hypothetical protein
LVRGCSLRRLLGGDDVIGLRLLVPEATGIGPYLTDQLERTEQKTGRLIGVANVGAPLLGRECVLEHPVRIGVRLEATEGRRLFRRDLLTGVLAQALGGVLRERQGSTDAGDGWSIFILQLNFGGHQSMLLAIGSGLLVEPLSFL